MRKLIYTTLIFAVANAAAIAAEAGYDYPPEFADLFEQFRVITPEEAQIDVALYGDDPWHTLAGGVILEPVLIKCVNGVPAYYLVLSYNGEDDGIRQEMEDVIRMLNDDEGFDPNKLDEKLTSLEPSWRDFRTFGKPAWTYGGAPGYSTAYVPDLFIDFRGYLESMKKGFGVRSLENLKIYGTHTAITAPVFGVRTPPKETLYYIPNPASDGVVMISESDLVKIFYEKTASIYDRFLKNADVFSSKKEHWEKLKGSVGEVEKTGKYLKVREYIGADEGGLDGYMIDDVPEFNVCTAPGDNYQGDCWVWSMVSDLVFHSQCENDYGKGLVWRDYKNPQGKNETPEFDTGTYNWGYGTWHFGAFVYISFVAAAKVDYASNLNEGAHEDVAAICADLCTECEGWKGENNEPKWKYWLRTAQNNPGDPDIEYSMGWLTYSLIQGKIEEGYPLSTHWVDYPGHQDPHAVPTWGWYITGGSEKMLKTWDNKPPFYVDKNVEHYESSGGIQIGGLLAKPPLGPGVGPWVSNFEVKRRWRRADLTWAVSVERDVKGFNVYREDGRGNLLQLNNQIIKHNPGDPFTYRYTDKDYEKGQQYVLELVRYTPDDVKYLIHQREIAR